MSSEKHNIATEHIIPNMLIMLIKFDQPPEKRNKCRKKKMEKGRKKHK